MADYPLYTLIDIGTSGLTLKAALRSSAGVLHPSLRNISCPEVGTTGAYDFASVSMPAGYVGAIWFYTGTATTNDFSDLGLVHFGKLAINPQQQENSDVLTSSIASAGGTGARAITITVKDTFGNPLSLATVRVYSISSPLDAGVVVTDEDGQAIFGLNEHNDYRTVAVKDGYTYTPDLRTVTGNEAGTLTADITMGVIAIPTPSEPVLCLVFGTLYKGDGSVSVNTKVVAKLHVPRHGPAKAGGVIVGGAVEVFTDDYGYFEMELFRTDELTPADCTWTLSCEEADFVKKNIRLTTGSLDIKDLIT